MADRSPRLAAVRGNSGELLSSGNIESQHLSGQDTRKQELRRFAQLLSTLAFGANFHPVQHFGLAKIGRGMAKS